MFDYNYKFILYSQYLHLVYNVTVIENYLNELTPENSLILVGSKEKLPNKIEKQYFNITKNETEKWYGTKYQARKLDKSYLSHLKINNNTEKFVLRPINEYITKQKNIVSCLDDKDDKVI